MADLFSDEQIAMFKKKFSRSVEDAGGTIKTKYVEQVMHSLGLDTREGETAGMIKKVTRMVDADGKGTINFEQFLSLLTLMTDFVNEERDGLPTLLYDRKTRKAREPTEPKEPSEQQEFIPPSRVVDKAQLVCQLVECVSDTGSNESSTLYVGSQFFLYDVSFDDIIGGRL